MLLNVVAVVVVVVVVVVVIVVGMGRVHRIHYSLSVVVPGSGAVERGGFGWFWGR